MSFAFRQMLHSVTRHDRGRETKTKGRDCSTRYDRHILRQHIRSRRAGSRIGRRIAAPPRLPEIIAPTPYTPSSQR